MRLHKNDFDIRKWTMVIALAGIWMLFSLIDQSGTFLSARNISNLFRQSAVTALLALGMFMILVDLHIDLSLGSLTGLSGGICAILMFKLGYSPALAVFLTLLLGILCGIGIGLIVNTGVPAFIVTLGGMLIYRGALMGVTNGESIPVSSSIFRVIGTEYLPPIAGIIIGILITFATILSNIKNRKNKIKYNILQRPLYLEIVYIVIYIAALWAFILVLNSYKGIPIPIAVVICAFVFFIMTAKTKFGKQIFAIGGNREAARLSGINIKTRTLQIFSVCGFMGSLSGILLISRLGTSTTDAGSGMELDAVAACVIGGTSLLGGEGSIIGALLGALIMASIDNGMSIQNTPAYWQYIIKGNILVAAVLIDVFTKKKNKI